MAVPFDTERGLRGTGTCAEPIKSVYLNRSIITVMRFTFNAILTDASAFGTFRQSIMMLGLFRLMFLETSSAALCSASRLHDSAARRFVLRHSHGTARV